MTTTAASGSGTSNNETSNNETSNNETTDGETTDGESSTDTGDSTTDTSQSGGSFYAGPDDFDWGKSTCDPFVQDCPEGEKCVAISTDGAVLDDSDCVPVTGDGEPGDPCVYGGVVSGTDDCDETSACWNVTEVDGELIGTCKAFCSKYADDPECPDGMSCLIDGEGSLTLCIESCDPIAQDCAEGFACYAGWNVFVCLYEADNVAVGETCEHMNDCEIGSSCWPRPINEPKTCTEFCSLSNPTCAAGTECVAFYDANPPVGYEDVGLCIIPG